MKKKSVATAKIFFALAYFLHFSVLWVWWVEQSQYLFDECSDSCNGRFTGATATEIWAKNAIWFLLESGVGIVHVFIRSLFCPPFFSFSPYLYCSGRRAARGDIFVSGSGEARARCSGWGRKSESATDRPTDTTPLAPYLKFDHF